MLLFGQFMCDFIGEARLWKNHGPAILHFEFWFHAHCKTWGWLSFSIPNSPLVKGFSIDCLRKLNKMMFSQCSVLQSLGQDFFLLFSLFCMITSPVSMHDQTKNILGSYLSSQHLRRTYLVFCSVPGPWHSSSKAHPESVYFFPSPLQFSVFSHQDNPDDTWTSLPMAEYHFRLPCHSSSIGFNICPLAFQIQPERWSRRPLPADLYLIFQSTELLCSSCLSPFVPQISSHIPATWQAHSLCLGIPHPDWINYFPLIALSVQI